VSRVFVVLFSAFVVVVFWAHGQARARPSCVLKGGVATGITRAFAEYEALLIIRQVTGNWPVETDRIDRIRYACQQDAVGAWTCRAEARVCRS
jgi:hypothetical protein